jgi:extracellular elastinolytic metalloproteinase
VNISGNNVHAYLDTDANNAADPGGTAVTDGTFGTLADLSQSPSTEQNKNVAVQNLFYLNNVLHDELYRHGFIAAEGNFQENNFGAGGRGSDSVNAEAQDGSGTDNANFATPRDGQNPRMQMFLWTGRGTHAVVVNAPPSIAGTYAAQGAEFGPALNTAGVTGDVALANDGTGTASDACEAIVDGSVAGKIALIDRGTMRLCHQGKERAGCGRDRGDRREQSRR